MYSAAQVHNVAIMLSGYTITLLQFTNDHFLW